MALPRNPDGASPAPLPANERERLAALASYDILDTLPERDFDDITFLASHICQTPIALISLIDHQRQWFKSRVGVELTETPRDLAFCAHAILKPAELMEIPDARRDERFETNPFVTEGGIRFYGGVPLVTSGGAAIGTLCAIDLVPRTLSDEQRRALSALAREVVTKLELRKTIKELTAAREAKSAFLANISHEIRTPMNAIVGMTSVLLDTQLTAAQKESAELVRQSGEHLLTIVNDVLDFSKMDAGRMELESFPMCLRECLESSLDLLSLGASQKKVKLGYRMEPGTPEGIRGDYGRLRQVFVNLIANAVKFTPAGGEVAVSVKSRLLPDGGRHELFISVRDTGIGIPADRLGSLFTPFTQVDASTTRKFGGTGLGLSISRHLVELMGGRIWVESQPERGSTFSFTFPTEATEFERLEAGRPALPLNFGERHPLRILVAEDNPVNQRVAKAMLERLSFHPDFAGNGLEVLAALERQRYDLIFMDVQMPELDGIETTREIRRRVPERLRPRIVGMSANAMDHDAEEGKRAGMADYISKPTTAEVLLRVLRETPRIDAEPAGLPAFDPSALSAFDEETAAELFELFLKDARRLLEAMKVAAAEDRLPALAELGHELKGSAAGVGAVALADQASQLQSLAEAGQRAALPGALSGAEARFAEVSRPR